MSWLSRLSLLSLMVFCSLGTNVLKADEPNAARSVHLGFPAPDAVAFYNEVTVEESVPGSYFMVCGFNHGYFGIQELSGPEDKVVLFSVWDPSSQDDPNSVPADRRVEVLDQAKDVRIGRFGNEGTGAQCFLKLNWKVGQTYRLLVTAKVEKPKTTYAAYIGLEEPRSWKHLATFRTVTGGDQLRGLYSFLEDFRRDGKSPKQTRRAMFGNGWAQTAKGDWIALTKARFTGDATPLNNMDAGVIGNRFWLATGGEVMNQTPLKSMLSWSPVELPEVSDKP
ncbi:MAG: DUF3472 domain-containing protein [Planctomycetia bacterium]|nr:DUF3472 domain-containing protein [Planctomycetia bacterium]